MRNLLRARIAICIAVAAFFLGVLSAQTPTRLGLSPNRPRIWDDAELRKEVDRLLTVFDAGGGSLAQSTHVTSSSRNFQTFACGDRVGRFSVVRLIGTGGMGNQERQTGLGGPRDWGGAGAEPLKHNSSCRHPMTLPSGTCLGPYEILPPLGAGRDGGGRQKIAAPRYMRRVHREFI